MNDKRPAPATALDTLGEIIDSSQKRDAIHLAVEPVIAGEDFFPGQHIKLDGKNAIKAAAGEGLGIVDPFLGQEVKKGERFWLVLYPRTIQSLRHVWSHPELPDEDNPDDPDEVPPAIRTLRKIESEKWLRRFCAKADCPSYEKVMEFIDKGSLPSPDSEYYTTGGEYTEESLHFVGSNANGKIPPEFWLHAEIVLEKKLERRPEYFSCSC